MGGADYERRAVWCDQLSLLRTFPGDQRDCDGSTDGQGHQRGLGVLLAGTFLLRAARWTEAGGRRAWQR